VSVTVVVTVRCDEPGCDEQINLTTTRGPAYVTIAGYEAEYDGWQLRPDRHHLCPAHRTTPLQTHPFEPFEGQDRAYAREHCNRISQNGKRGRTKCHKRARGPQGVISHVCRVHRWTPCRSECLCTS
jgi:hypothetical protein